MIETLSNEEKIYKGNLLFTFRTLLAIVFVVCISVLVLTHLRVFLRSNGAIFSISLALVFVITITIFQLHYFVIFNGQLLVKNQILNWTTGAYLLNEITAIELVKGDAVYQIPNSLRITYKNKTKLYRAASLEINNWKDLLNDLRKQNVKVNESRFGR
jgi:hypothetical protein